MSSVSPSLVSLWAAKPGISVTEVVRLLGPPLGGVIAAGFSLPGIAILDAATYVFAASMIVFVTTSGTVVAQRDEGGAAVHIGTTVWQDLVDGLALLVRTRVLRITFGVFAISRIGEGVFAVMFIVWVTEVLGGGAWELGLLFGAQAIGGILGGMIVGRIGTALGPARLLWMSTIVFGLLDLALFNYPRFVTGLPLGLGLMALVGVPAVGFGAGLITLRQTATEDRYRGRIFGAFGTIGAVFYLLSTALTGVVAPATGPLTLLNVQGGAYVVAGVLALLLLDRRHDGPPHPTPAERSVTSATER